MPPPQQPSHSNEATPLPVPISPQVQATSSAMKALGIPTGTAIAACAGVLLMQYLGFVPKTEDLTQIREDVRTVADGVNRLADAINTANQSGMTRSTFNEWVLLMKIENPQIKWVDPRTLSMAPTPLLPTIPIPPRADASHSRSTMPN